MDNTRDSQESRVDGRVLRALVGDDPVDYPVERDFERKQISKTMCVAINDYLENHTQREAANYFSIARSTVQKHDQRVSYKECQHDDGFIDTRRCAAARAARLDGVLRKEIADRYGVDPTTVTHHTLGRCTCDHTVEPVTESDKVL